MTALEMYREDRQNRRDAEKRKPRQEYFILLRDTLYEELTGEGRSEFLEEMIAEGGKALPALEFAALRECFAAIVDGRRMKDASVHVPHLLRGVDQPLTWQDLENGPAFRVDDPQMPEMLIRLRRISYQLVSARDQTPAVEAERAVNREIAGLRAVNHALERDNTSLRAERDELLERVRQMEEGVISRQLQNKADARRYQLEAELEKEMADKRRALEEDMHQALRLAARSQQEEREAADRAAAQEDARRAAASQQQRTALQEFIARQVETLRQSMGNEDYRFLAQSYAEMRGVIASELPAIIGDAQLHGADETLLTALTALDASLGGRMRRMEQALLQLGLQLYTPQAGEKFDSALHSPVNATGPEGQGVEREIAAVQSPGVRRIRADGQGETLVRALVHTRRKQEKEPASAD